MMLQLMAFDDAGNWNEADHPRDETGKFTKGGAVTASLAKAGWKKTADIGNETQYNGPLGEFLVVQKDSGQFSGLIDGKVATGTGKADLPLHLQKGGDGTGGKTKEQWQDEAFSGPYGQSQASPSMTQKQQDYLVSSHVGKVIKDAGFKKTKSADGALTFAHPSGAKVVIHPPAPDKKFSSEWTHFKDGVEKKGTGVAIAKVLGQAVKKAEAKKTEASTVAPASITKHADLPAGKAEGTADVKSFLTDKGYSAAPKTDYGTFVFDKPDGATVELDPKTGDWIASTPGHMKKEGNGANSLALLLSGKPAVFKGAEQPPWKNTTKANLDPQAAAKAAAQEAETKKLAGAANATQSMLMKAAPEPTPSEAKAATKYTGSAYASWNDKLRHDPDFIDTDTKALDSYLAKSEFPEDVTVFRKVSGEYSKILKSILIEGTKFVDHGYVSTSTHQGTWSGDMQWVITVKKGQKGASVKKLSKFSSENEVLLPRSTAFVVKKFDRKAGLVHVEVDQSHLEHKWKANA